MAVFSQATAGREVSDYLYELNENLTYMFNNLTPEDNYSEEARLIYVERGEHIASLQVQADKIDLRVQNNETNYNTSITLLADLLSLTASTPEDTSSVELTGDKIELKTGKFIVNAKNLTIDALGNAVFSGKVTAAQIESSTITGGTISGTVMSASTINGTTINGTTINSSVVNAATITGGTINGTIINGGDDIRFKARPGYLQFGDFEVDDTYGRHIFQSYDEVTGMSTGDISAGEMLLWAGWNGTTATFRVFEDEVRIRGDLYINGEPLDDYILSVVGDNDDDSGDDSGGSSPGGTSSGGDSGGPTGDETDPILGGG